MLSMEGCCGRKLVEAANCSRFVQSFPHCTIAVTKKSGMITKDGVVRIWCLCMSLRFIREDKSVNVLRSFSVRCWSDFPRS